MSYQRNSSPTKIKTITKNFDKNAVGILIVSLRENGNFFIIDGQHRLEAMKKRGMMLAQCQVCKGLTLEQEAEIYIWCNTARKNPNALDVLRARIVRQEPTAITINNIVEKHGLHIQFHEGGRKGQRRPPTGVYAVSAIEEIYMHGKEKLLETVLTLAVRSWPNDGYALEARVLLGISDFHLKYQGQYDREEFISKMNITDLNTLRRRSQYHAENNGGALRKSFAKALQEAYDKGKRSRRLEEK